MFDKERRAFWRGYRDFEMYMKQKQLGIARLFDSRYSLPWRPPEGCEDAYTAGWQTARRNHSRGEDHSRRLAGAA